MPTEAYGSGVPRLINTPQPSRNSSQPVPTGLHLGIVGEFPTLDPSAVYTVTTPQGLNRLGPKDYHLGLVGQLAYNPAASEPLATKRPASVKLVNALSSTAANVTTVDADAANSLKFTSVKFGPTGNRSSVVVASATNKSATGGKKYTFTSGDGLTEVWDDVGYGNVLTLNYTGSQATTMTVAYTIANGLRVSYTKTAIAVGTLTNTDLVFDGTITFTPSTGAGVGETFTVTTNGINKATGLSDSEALTWNNADGTDPKTTTKAWSSVTTIVIAVTAGTPTFTAAGYAFDLDVTDCPKVSDLVVAIEAQAPFEVTASAPNASALNTNELDELASVTCKASPVSLTANVQAALDRLAGSAIFTVARASGGGLKAPANGTYQPAGGTTGSVSATTYEDALALLVNQTVDVLWVDSTDSAVHAKVLAHTNAMLVTGGKARIAHLGLASSTSLTAYQTAIQALNSYTIGSVWAQNFQRADQTGTTVNLDPKYLALVVAALQCALPIGEPLTNKRITASSYSQAATIDPDNNQAGLIALNVSFIATLNGAIQLIRPLTAYLVGDNTYYDEPGSVCSFFASVNDVNNEFARIRAIGSANTRLTQQDVQAIGIRRLNAQKTANPPIIKNFDPNSVLATENGADWYRLSWDEQPISGVNFVETMPTVTTVPA